MSIFSSSDDTQQQEPQLWQRIGPKCPTNERNNVLAPMILVSKNVSNVRRENRFYIQMNQKEDLYYFFAKYLNLCSH